MKTDPGRVNPGLARRAIELAKDRGCVYSECVRLSWKTTGNLAPGFDNKDLTAWIDLNMPEVFDKRGHKQQPQEPE